MNDCAGVRHFNNFAGLKKLIIVKPLLIIENNYSLLGIEYF